jgi:predicted DCC family thiol-disulfide oxidoreductase YuxK
MGWVLFYDGDCVFCARAVQQLIRRDPHRRIAFAPLQGRLAGSLGLTRHAAKRGGTLILLRESDGEIYMKSSALIELARALGGGWRALALAHFIPRPLRDWGYALVADHRHLLRGKSSSCPLPSAELQARLRD